MSRKISLILLAAALCVVPAIAAGGVSDDGRAGWILARAEAGEATVQLASLPVGADDDFAAPEIGEKRGGVGKAVPMLMSLVLPGLGEAYLGHKRGYVMMAADVAGWIGVKHYDDKGDDLETQYKAYADVHWSETRLDESFNILNDPAWGHHFFPDVNSMEELPLWVSRIEDEREYYENLGKWDQFVFGWDDFIAPADLGLGLEADIQYLKDPRVSANREIYRSMRRDSNDQFTKRDNLLYFNMLLRVFSIFQVAWLQGMFGDGDQPGASIAGYDVALVAEPVGMTGSRLGFTVSY